MIEIENLSFRYGDAFAVNGLSLQIPDGCLFGLLGPNGAGKTTTISCIAGLRAPTSGSIRVAGADVQRQPNEVKRLLGVAPQSIALYPMLSVLQNLRFFGGHFGLQGEQLRQRVEWGLALAQLEGKSGARVETLSGGMKRRLNLACALLHDPKVIICDEPTTGVDPQSRNHLFETIRELHRQGRTILYTTHYMEEIETLCSRVAILDHGKLLTEKSLGGLLAEAGAPTRYQVNLGNGCEPEVLLAALRAAGVDVASALPAPRSLEEVFLELTGRALRDEAS